MELVALLSYVLVNVAMVAHYFRGKGRYFEFPFWAATLALGWFLPMAIGGLSIARQFPDGAYTASMFFAVLCTLALWAGYAWAVGRVPQGGSWLGARFDARKLYWAGAFLCSVGFFFQYKLSTLPEELTSMTQWSGAAVKYLFLSNIFIFGFVTLWLLYLSKRRFFSPGLLLFILPSLFLLVSSAVLKGRRAAMMNLVSYLAASLWFVRRVALPRWMLVVGLCFGLTLVNAIGVYRSIMYQKDLTLSERLAKVAEADLSGSTANVLQESGAEFMNYVYYRQIYVETGEYDFGAAHWNELVFNYVPAQIVGRGLKESLMVPLCNHIDLAAEKYGYFFGLGTTTTGYFDAFASFAWLGFVKYLIIGGIMGVLYRHAMQGDFLGQLLYVYALGTAMHAISHGTNAILLSIWVYFFGLAYPTLFLARYRPPPEGEAEIRPPGEAPKGIHA